VLSSQISAQGRLGDICELFVTIQGQEKYLWHAVDQGGAQHGG